MNRKLKHHYSAQGEQERKDLPDYLAQGEQARLFPVLSDTSKEGRTTSIVLACMAKIDEFGDRLLGSIGQSVGKRKKIETYTEIVFKNHTGDMRPDGLIVLPWGKSEWRALVETKVDKRYLDPEQVERYRTLAKENGIDCVITISNQFATTPSAHPLVELKKSRSKIKVFHWSWVYILTEADLLLRQGEVSDDDQKMLLNELRRFLSHKSAGVRRFDSMPTEWSKVNKLVSSGGVIPKNSKEAEVVIAAWHQEIRDLTLILSSMTGTAVTEYLSKKELSDANANLRVNSNMKKLRETKQLTACLNIPGAAAPIDVVADLRRKHVDVGMTLKAPKDKQSTKARVNWILNQVKKAKVDKFDDLYLRLIWPRPTKNKPTQCEFTELLKDVKNVADDGKEHLAPDEFHLFMSRNLGRRFITAKNFIKDLEEIIPAFYRDYGSNLVAWKPPAPKIKEDRKSPQDVTPEAFSDESSDFDPS